MTTGDGSPCVDGKTTVEITGATGTVTITVSGTVDGT
jgi:hypothetical protein